MQYRNVFWLLLVAFAARTRAAESLPRATPESQGVPSAKLQQLYNAFDEKVDGIHSLMVVRHGHVIAEGWWEPYDAPHNHVLYSLSKSFTSTAVGLAVAEGRLSIDDPVLKFFPEDAPDSPSNNLQSMRVRDLLTMSTGHQDEPSAAADVISPEYFLAQPVPHLPGTHFKYNTAATFMQSAIVQKVTGETVLDYLRPRLFEPLGIENPQWSANFQGISLGGYGLRVRTEDIAKFGQLYLQKGAWNGEQLLPADWIALATSKQTSNGSDPNNDWNQGYGFQFWRCRHNAYRGDGAFGQFCIVMPDQDMVVAITSGVSDMGSEMQLIWDYLLPIVENQPLPENTPALSELKNRLDTLRLDTPEGTATPESATKYLNRVYTFEDNDQQLKSVSLPLHSDDNGQNLSIRLRIADQTVDYPCAHGSWRNGRALIAGGRNARFPDEPVAGAFAWEDAKTLHARITAYETPFQWRVTVKFSEETLTWESRYNVGFGGPNALSIQAKVE